MNRLTLNALLLLFLFLVPACGGKTPPEPSAYQGKKVLTAVRDLARTYEKQDEGGFLDLISPATPLRAAMQRDLRAVYARYPEVRFSFLTAKMLVLVPRQGNIEASVNWTGDWSTGKGDLVKDGGRVSLLFDPATFLLVAIDGKNPFVPAPASARP